MKTLRKVRPLLVEHGWVEDRAGRLGQILTCAGPGACLPWVKVRWADTGDLGRVFWPSRALRPVPGPPGPVADLEWALPTCPLDAATVVGNGDGYACPRCQTRWDPDGRRGIRVCASDMCGADADLVDAAGVPRCSNCANTTPAG